MVNLYEAVSSFIPWALRLQAGTVDQPDRQRREELAS